MGPEQGVGMDVAVARMRAAFDPALTARIDAFDDAVAAFRAIPCRSVVVAVVGLVPGAGRSTVVGLTALAAAAYSDRRVVVIDTAAVHAPATMPAPVGDAGMVAAGTVTELLGGVVADGRITTLLDTPVRSGVPRALIARSLTPGTAAPVLSLAPGSGEFTPQLLEQALGRLRHRADLVLVDTPPGPGHPVLHAALDLADHFLLVVRGDRNAGAQIAAGCHWLASAPGRHRERPVSVVAVCRGLRSMPRATPAGAASTGTASAGSPDPDFPGAVRPGITVLARDEALRRRRLDRVSRRSAVTGLRLAGVASSAGSRSDGLGRAHPPERRSP